MYPFITKEMYTEDITNEMRMNALNERRPINITENMFHIAGRPLGQCKNKED